MILEEVSNKWFSVPSSFDFIMIFPIFWLPKIIKNIYIYIYVESGLQILTGFRLHFS